ncbi:ADP-glyceromanno-heptose 6-epimerase [Candidatus Omnitrophota bacterium]
MKVVVTGATGFIGSCLIWKLNQMGIEDIIAVDVAKIPDECHNILRKKYSKYIDREKFLESVKKNTLEIDIDMVIHFGACSSTTETDVEYLTNNNFLYSKELGEWCLRNKKRYLYASSAATYGAGNDGYSDDDLLVSRLAPLNEYGRSKQKFDMWVIDNGLQREFVGFKFFNVYGPNEYHKGDMRSMVNKGYHQIKETGKICLFKSYRQDYKDGEQKRDFIYVKDAIDMVIYFIENPDKCGIYNIGTGQARTWNDLADALFKALNIDANIEYIDMPPQIREQYQYFTEADMDKLKGSGCPCNITDIYDAVADYVGYLEEKTYL